MDFNHAMNEALKQRKYDKLAGRIFDWREWLKERAMELLTRLLESISIDFSALFKPGSNGWINDWIRVLRLAGIILLVIVFVRLALYIIKRVKQRNKASKGIFEGIDKEGSTAAGLLESSARLAAGGYPRDAVRYGLAAILLALDRKKIYRLNYTKTNGQIIRELRYKAPFIIPALSSIVDVFNIVWFGHRNLTVNQFNKYWQDASILVAEVEAYKNE